MKTFTLVCLVIGLAMFGVRADINLDEIVSHKIFASKADYSVIG